MSFDIDTFPYTFHFLDFSNDISFILQVTYDNETEQVEYDVSEMRLNPTYIRWYTLSYLLHPTLTLTVGPVVIVTCLNYKIYRSVVKGEKVCGPFKKSFHFSS